MGQESMVVVSGELLSAHLPVAAVPDFVHAAHDFDAAFAAVHQRIKVPGHVTEGFHQARGIFIEVGEDEPFVRLYPGDGFHAELRLVEISVAGFLQRHRCELSVEPVGPAMEGAGEAAAVAPIGAGNLHPAVPACVEHDLDPSVALTDDEHRVQAHVGGDEISALLQLAFVRDEQPGPHEDLPTFDLKETGIVKDLGAEQPGFRLYQVVDVNA